MSDEDFRILKEAHDFLLMMQRAYHEVWRRRECGAPEISPECVLVLFGDCEHYRCEVARIAIAALDEGSEPPAPALHSLDAVWRSLWAAANGRRPSFVPRRVVNS